MLRLGCARDRVGYPILNEHDKKGHLRIKIKEEKIISKEIVKCNRLHQKTHRDRIHTTNPIDYDRRVDVK